MKPLTDDDLRRLIELEANTTSGPWGYDDGITDDKTGEQGKPKYLGSYSDPSWAWGEGDPNDDDDGRFIAAARNALPGIATELIALRERVRELETPSELNSPQLHLERFEANRMRAEKSIEAAVSATHQQELGLRIKHLKDAACHASLASDSLLSASRSATAIFGQWGEAAKARDALAQLKDLAPTLTTHWETCWRLHHGCAIALIELLLSRSPRSVTADQTVVLKPIESPRREEGRATGSQPTTPSES